VGELRSPLTCCTLAADFRRSSEAALKRPARNVLLLIGSGAEVNSWEPVTRALRRVGGLDIESPDEANGYLAHVVQARRYFSMSNAYLEKRNSDEHPPSTSGLAESNDAYARVCDAIRDELRIAEAPGHANGIKLRPEFSDVWNVVANQASRICVMTTNWDLTILEEVQRRWPTAGDDAVMHLHGDRRDVSGFLLPTEMTFEPYRDEASIQLLSKRRGAIMKALEAAERVVIYGLSLAPLDAELAQVVAWGMDSGRVDDVEIIDPEHRRIARRLMALIPSRRPKVLGREPSTLGAVTQHAWTR
jgi:hypothetical protein